MTPQSLNRKSAGDGPAVVLLHPVGLDMTCWHDVAGRLQSRFRVVMLDLRGHGASPPADAGMTLADYAADVRHTLAAAGIDRSAIVGLSFGGMVAQAFALDYPETVTQLVVAACPSTLPDEARTALAARGRAGAEHGMASLVEGTLERWFTPGFIEKGGALAVRDRLLRTDSGAWDSAWQAISRIDTRPRLGEIAVPTLCIAGELDPASPPAALAAIAERVPGARLDVMNGAPHMMQIECPAAFADLLDQFLRR